MHHVFIEEIGKGRLIMKAVVIKVQEGISVYIGGGNKYHIGSVVISQPRLSLTGTGMIRCTTSVFNLLGHKDDEIAVPMAEKLCTLLNTIVVVTAGIHIDDAKAEDIQIFKEQEKQMTHHIISRLLSA